MPGGHHGRLLKRLQDAPAATSDAPPWPVCAAGGSIDRPRTWWNSLLRHRHQPTFPNARGVRLPLWPSARQRGARRVSSGAAVSVASGAFSSLGSRHRGSIPHSCRVQRHRWFQKHSPPVPLPLAPCHCPPPLDTACALTRSVRDAIVAHEVCRAPRHPQLGPLFAWLAVPTHTFPRWTGWHREQPSRHVEAAPGWRPDRVD